MSGLRGIWWLYCVLGEPRPQISLWLRFRACGGLRFGCVCDEPRPQTPLRPWLRVVEGSAQPHICCCRAEERLLRDLLRFRVNQGHHIRHGRMHLQLLPHSCKLLHGYPAWPHSLLNVALTSASTQMKGVFLSVFFGCLLDIHYCRVQMPPNT